jgi:hypothetical protein
MKYGVETELQKIIRLIGYFEDRIIQDTQTMRNRKIGE